MDQPVAFDDIARIPLPGDNVAIATRRLEAGTQIQREDETFKLTHTVMEGHRFSLTNLSSGDPLLSWNLPFGVATTDITPGEYVCNSGIIDALSLRDLDFDLPSTPNFEDRIVPFDVKKETFVPGQQVPATDKPRFFEGYRRDGRGVGTRNVVLILGTSSRTGSFAKMVEREFEGKLGAYPNIDGVVAVAHTEGGESDKPNNYEYVLRTLSGFFTHANVGAVLAVDYGTESINNDDLLAYLNQNGYPTGKVPHAFFRIDQAIAESLSQARQIVENWLPAVNDTPRTPEPVSELKIALQCGGSDAFSGVSGNPLASWVAREVIRNGGAANLAETDELIGAEAYVLQNAKDVETAQKFVDKVEGYKELAAWHGTTAEGNPSGGNKYRGLYNIVLKSIGAAMKRHPDVRLDAVIDYGEPMVEPGYYFMDSPGNDLESIAGQVASGCNMIFFVTGNGSITNFPFVPTLKIITTTERYELLSGEMDVNAGAYLDGQLMDDLGAEFFEQTLRVAEGERSKGEKAEHAQVSLWRNWRQTNANNLQQIESQPSPTGKPIPISDPMAPLTQTFRSREDSDGNRTSDAVGLLLPTSLCSGQIAQKAADTLNDLGVGIPSTLSRYTALVHTEGCGVAGEETERIYTRSMLNYLTHPSVKYAFLMEHGCEKTHNDFIRHHLEENGIDRDRFGWASIQIDGGIDNVMRMAEAWFRAKAETSPEVTFADASVGELTIGVATSGVLDPTVAKTAGVLTNRFCSTGGTVIVPGSDSLWSAETFLDSTTGGFNGHPSIHHGGRPEEPGLHAMENPTAHWVETLTGLAAAGPDVIVAFPGEHPLQGHPLVPVIQVGSPDIFATFERDLDAVASPETVEDLVQHIAAVAGGEKGPNAGLAHTDFQFTRGLLGVSM